MAKCYSLTAGVVSLFLHYHIAILPVFYPKLSGIHNAQLTASNAPAWRHILHTQELEQPDGAILEWRETF